MRFASLGSGSEGNALIIACDGRIGRRYVLVDCGFGLKDTAERLQRRGLAFSDLAGVFLTHEHSDHASGAFRVAKAAGVPLYLTYGTLWALERCIPAGLEVHVIAPDAAITFHELEILPFTVPHDAREPVQYRFDDGRSRLGVLTDFGCVTPHIVNTLMGCESLILEFNHDVTMLEQGPYPPSLKARILGRWGHIDNLAAMGLLDQLRARASTPRWLVGAHLSRHNNCVDKVRALMAGWCATTECEYLLADQDAGTDWVTAE